MFIVYILLFILIIVFLFYFIIKKVLKDKTKLGKTFIILEISGVILIFIFCLFFIKPDLIDLFAGGYFGKPFIFSIMWTLLLSTLYFFIRLFKKSKKLFIIVLSLFVLSILLYNIIDRTEKFNRLDKIDPGSVLFGNYNSLINDEKAYYFIPRNVSGKLYYTDDSYNEKLVCQNLKDDNYDIAYFSFIENDEIYYDTGYDFNKINIKNCKITDLVSDYRFINKVGDYAYLYSFKNEIIKYDYKNEKIVDKKTINTEYSYFNVIIDYDNFDIYYAYNDNFVTYKAMKNDEVLFESDIKLEILSFGNDIVLFTDELFIYKYNLKENRVVNMIDKPFKSGFAIRSDNGENYFIVDYQYIYKYDSVIDDIIEITKIDTHYLYDVYHVNDKVIFAGDEVYVYDLMTNETTRYDRVGSYTKNDSDFELSVIEKPKNKIVIIK